MASRSTATPVMGAYWLRPARMWCATRSSSNAGESKSGKPWERLIAPHSLASADIVVNIVVPTSGRREVMGRVKLGMALAEGGRLVGKCSRAGPAKEDCAAWQATWTHGLRFRYHAPFMQPCFIS